MRGKSDTTQNFCLAAVHADYTAVFFGDPWKKKTCLWLKGLPPLQPDNVVEPKGYWVTAHGHDKAPYGIAVNFRDQKTRSKTFEGIARAMAAQWEVIR